MKTKQMDKLNLIFCTLDFAFMIFGLIKLRSDNEM